MVRLFLFVQTTRLDCHSRLIKEDCMKLLGYLQTQCGNENCYCSVAPIGSITGFSVRRRHRHDVKANGVQLRTTRGGSARIRSSVNRWNGSVRVSGMKLGEHCQKVPNIADTEDISKWKALLPYRSTEPSSTR